MLNNRLLESCKEALLHSKGTREYEYLTVFAQRQDAAKKANDSELEGFMKLLWGIFSMYFQFAKAKPFGALMSGSSGRTMMVEDLTEDELNTLEELVKEINGPTFVARIYDVLWIRKHNYSDAKKAVSSYLQLIDLDQDESWVPKSEWLKRSTQIAMELGEKSPERKVIKDKLLALFEDSRKTCFDLKQDYWPAAILKLIIDNKLVDDWDELGNKIMEIAKGFPITPGLDAPRKYYELASKCYRYANQKDKEQEAKLALAQHWEDEGRSFRTPEGCDGFNLAHRLEKAIHAYREAGKSEKAEELIYELKEANKEAINQMKSIRAEVDITDLVKFTDDSMQNKQGKEVLLAFGSLYQGSSYERNKAFVEDLAEKNPLQGMLGKSIFTPEGNVSVKTQGILTGDEESGQVEVVRHFDLNQNMLSSTILKRAITFILQSGEIWKDALKKLIDESIFVPKERQMIFERAIIAGLEGDRVLFAHLIIPQIENSIRTIFALNKLKITSVYPNGVQQERDLNELLKDTEAKNIFGENMIWEMRTLLIEKSGTNFRNRICHGLMSVEEIDNSPVEFLMWLVIYLIVGFARNPDGVA